METIDHHFPWEPLTIVPLSDLQLGGPGADIKRFKWHVQQGVERDAWFCLVGDMQDNASPSNRKKLREAGLYDSTILAIEKVARDTYEETKEILAPIKGRTLFVAEGHHKYVFENGDDTDIMMAEYLEAPYVGTSVYETLHFRRRGGATITCNILARHGEWSSKSSSLLLRKMELDLLPHWPEVDVFMLAHAHQADAKKLESLIRRGDDIRGKQRLLVVTGGWLKGYVANHKRGGKPEGTYVEQQLLPPTSISGVSLDIIPVHTSAHDYLQLEAHLL